LNSVQNILSYYKERIKTIFEKRIFSNPDDLFSSKIMKLDDYNKRLLWAMERSINNEQKRFNILQSKLNSLSPLKTLKRGYTLTTNTEGELIRKINDINKSDNIITRFSDGKIISQVIKKISDGDFNGS
jgi:exodeoxyribonuclease VII large subunit